MAKKTNTPLPTNEHLWKKRDISSFLNEEYRDYSLYCAMERCTPSLVDGFKLTQRKILHSAFKGACKSGNLVKLLNLTGDVLKETVFSVYFELYSENVLLGAEEEIFGNRKKILYE